MHISSTAELLALGLTVLVHFLGAGVLIWAMLGDEPKETRPGWRDWWPRDDDPDLEPVGDPAGGLAVPVLSDAAQSAVRLREPGRLSEGRPRPARRPEHEPLRVPDREREEV